MARVHLVLASQSPARLATLKSAGVTPSVVVSGVDEDAALAAAEERFGEKLDPADAALVLAQAKAESVANALEDDEAKADEIGLQVADSVVLACDSILELDGESFGKPETPEVAIERWKAMRGGEGILHTGHWLIDLRDTDADGTGATLGATSSTLVRFAHIDDAEIEAYVATGEPLQVAGGFTVDGLGGPYIDSIEGDFHGVVGVSLPLVRELFGEIGVAFSDLR